MTVRRILNPSHYVGLSTDLKPSSADEQGVEEGSRFYEADTGRMFVFERLEWRHATPRSDAWLEEILGAAQQTLLEIKQLLEGALNQH